MGPYLGLYSGIPPALVSPFCYLGTSFSPSSCRCEGSPQTRGFREIAGELFSLHTLHVVEGAKQNCHLDPGPVACLAEEGLRCVPGLVGMGVVEMSFLPPLCPPCSPASLGQGLLIGLGLQNSPASRGCPSSQSALLSQTLAPLQRR